MREKVESLTLKHFKYLPEILGYINTEIQDLSIINCSLGSSMFNVVFGGSEIDPKEIINIFKNQPFAWWIPPSFKSSNLPQKLYELGFTIEANEEIMLCELDSFESKYSSETIQISQVLTIKELQDFISILKVYDKSAEIFYSQLTSDILNKQEKLFIGYNKNNIPVTIAIAFQNQDMVGIFSLITKDEERGKGFGFQMMNFLMNFAKENGANYACLSSSSISGYKIYENLGFKVIGRFECFEYKGK